MALACALLLGQYKLAAQEKMPPATIRGTVQDTAGRAVSNALVRLEAEGNTTAKETKSDEKGQFVFSGLKTGKYVLTAMKDGSQSHTAIVTVATGAKVPEVALILASAVSPSAQQESMASAQAMEFADNPNFTVAAVTDWTAAGGHGSDATLRASEALTRETMRLQAQNAREETGASSGQAVSETEKMLLAARAASPASFGVNHNLGAFYLERGRFAEAVEPLRIAYKANPGDVDNAYELVQALKGADRFAEAHTLVEQLLARYDTADLHRAAGEIDEKLNDPLNAVREFEKATRENPSEENYFAWGSELLFHRAVWQAKAVFEEGVKAYPKSERMLTALGTALFSGAMYEDAAQRLCEASDLNPGDAQPYVFLGKVEMASPNPLPCVEQKLARFVQLQPKNALANYYYAMTLWKQQGPTMSEQARERIAGLLNDAVRADAKCSEAFLQLGNLRAQLRDYPKAIGYYEQAIEANPQLSEAHYRLGMAYDRAGEREKAQREFQLHDKLQKEQAAEVDRQRREIKQFLVVEPGKAEDKVPHP